MKQVKKLTVIASLALLLTACSKPPSESIVESLIEAQYEQTDKVIEDAVANASNDKMAKTMSNMMERMMPRLERIDNINCDNTEGWNNYICTADITQTIAGTSRIDKTRFNVSKVNGEWVLGE
ncbi:hypothetical protein AAJP47_02480 [Psychrobacter sp. B38]|uniref:hypothetical protein n=1 Tax=Psychrobacter sp. B38 TaxID=3143538 RepID=UPI00320D2E84